MLDYKIFMKHAEKVTKNAPESRPVLKGVKHLDNGTAVVTDSQRLYVARGIHAGLDGVVMTPNGKVMKGSYPDVTKLIPDPSYAKYSLVINTDELLKGVDIIASVGAIAEKAKVEGLKDGEGKPLEPKPPALILEDDGIRYENVQVRIKYSTAPLHFEEPICANVFYVLDAMKLFKATGDHILTFRYYGAMRPFSLTNPDDSLLVLILPIRKY